MSYIIDRRSNNKNKSMVNRQRFLRRYRAHIKGAVDDAVNRRSIKDIERGENISIPTEDIEEPVFHHGAGGRRDIVLPGNKEFVAGDQIARPKEGGGGAGGGNASDQGEGIDDFVFHITQDEFLDFLFDELELPFITKKQLLGKDSFKLVRAGFSSVGTPNKINIVRSLRSANARRMALTASKRRRLRLLEEQLEEAQLENGNASHEADDETRQVKAEIDQLKEKIQRVPFIDDFDIKYNLHQKQPTPTSRAVMFCLMDVSGSMTQATKDIAKRFFILLHLFLQRNYEYTEVVFIRHHTSAKEVDEEEFFYSRETGGTIVSSALKLMNEIVQQRYSPEKWNIYGAQASDGDNWNDDSSTCQKLLINHLMPMVQYFSYIEITPRDHQALWEEYTLVQQQYPKRFSMQNITDATEIYPVFQELFAKRVA